MLEKIYNVLLELNLLDIVIYKTKDITPFFDYNVIATAPSSRQMDAACHHIEEEVCKCGGRVRGIEGKSGGTWVLIDLNDILVNIFYNDERTKYGLDNMWKDLEKVKFN